MSSFNSFYFLHIPKTGGRLFFYNVLFPLKDIFLESNIKELNILEMNGPINYYDHSQWKKEINSLTQASSFWSLKKSKIDLATTGPTSGIDSKSSRLAAKS